MNSHQHHHKMKSSNFKTEDLLESVKKSMMEDLGSSVDSTGKTIDQSAMTTDELVSLSGAPYATTRDRAKVLVKTGRWEQVWKRSGHRILKAYRQKKASQ